MTTIRPDAETLVFQTAEYENFWRMNKSLLNEMRNSWKAAGKPFPSSFLRYFLETFYAGENGKYGNEWLTVIKGDHIYYPEMKYKDLLKFMIEKHNITVQLIRDDAKGIREYEEWLKTQKTPFQEINETIKNAALLIGVLIAGYIIIK